MRYEPLRASPMEGPQRQHLLVCPSEHSQGTRVKTEREATTGRTHTGFDEVAVRPLTPSGSEGKQGRPKTVRDVAPSGTQYCSASRSGASGSEENSRLTFHLLANRLSLIAVCEYALNLANEIRGGDEHPWVIFLPQELSARVYEHEAVAWQTRMHA